MGGDHFNEPVNQFGSKTGTVHIELLREKIVDLFHVRRNRLGIGRREDGFQLLLSKCAISSSACLQRAWCSFLGSSPSARMAA